MKVRSVDDLLEPPYDNCFNSATISKDEVLALYDRQYERLSKKIKG